VSTVYTTAYSTPEFILRDRSNLLELFVRANGAAVTVVSGTCTVKNGTTVVDGPTAITIGGSGQAQHTLAAALVPESEPFSQRWSVRWDDIVVGSDTLPPTIRDAHLVLRTLPPAIDAADILKRNANLSRQFTSAEIQIKVQDAHDDMLARLLGDGRFPQMIQTVWSTRDWHRNLTMSYLYDELAAHAVGGQWDKDQKKWEDRAEKAFNSLNWKADTDQDGADDGTTEAASPVVMLFERAPVGVW
jgi:hypothetical protein